MLDMSAVLCTCSDVAEAERLAGGAVAAHLAACENILPGVQSVYMWQEQVEYQQEYQLLFKTKKSAEPA